MNSRRHWLLRRAARVVAASTVAALLVSLSPGCGDGEHSAKPKNVPQATRSAAERVDMTTLERRADEHIKVPFAFAPGATGTLRAEIIDPPSGKLTSVLTLHVPGQEPQEIASTTIYGIEEYGTVDLYEEEGRQAVLLVEMQQGTAYTTTVLRIVNPSHAECVSMTLSQSHQATRRVTGIDTSANFHDGRFAAERAFLEEAKYLYGAEDAGTLAGKAGELEYAPYFWALANENIDDGVMTIRRLPGRHPTLGSREDTLADGDVTYTAVFKGAVWAYDAAADESFVVFHPHDMYAWPTQLGKDGRWLLIVTGGEGFALVDVKTWRLKRVASNAIAFGRFSVSDGKAHIDNLTVDLAPPEAGTAVRGAAEAARMPG
ncbi:MAG: hypothetical protein KGY99_11275 [Phycisphaerae bacterium]|nr:hypothetical protein [Phycisphaerae bacterium]